MEYEIRPDTTTGNSPSFEAPKPADSFDDNDHDDKPDYYDRCYEPGDGNYGDDEPDDDD